ncbi:MAG TPA: hypothetical protein PK466_08790 [Thermotogota bacterium]|nr:hypothetical protein [Thermotogota bacterium]
MKNEKDNKKGLYHQSSLSESEFGRNLKEQIKTEAKEEIKGTEGIEKRLILGDDLLETAFGSEIDSPPWKVGCFMLKKLHVEEKKIVSEFSEKTLFCLSDELGRLFFADSLRSHAVKYRELYAKFQKQFDKSASTTLQAESLISQKIRDQRLGDLTLQDFMEGFETTPERIGEIQKWIKSVSFALTTLLCKRY